MNQELGTEGWVALVALFVGVLVRLLRADKLNEAFAKFNVPAIPKLALPWVALALGYLTMALEARMSGASWGTAAMRGLYGLLSGALAIAGYEAVANPVAKAAPTVGHAVFGKKPDCPPEPEPGSDTPTVLPG